MHMEKSTRLRGKYKRWNAKIRQTGSDMFNEKKTTYMKYDSAKYFV